MLHKFKLIAACLMLAVLFTACARSSESVAEVVQEGEQEIVEAIPESEKTEAEEPQTEPVQITGTVELSNAIILEIYFFERFVMLEDLTGFVQRDYTYEQPLEAQILGPVTVDEEGVFSYTLNLPAAPTSPLNDVDNDEYIDQGVQIWQVIMSANYRNDPFLGERETQGWSAFYTSAHIDSENKDEITGGSLVIWAPDDKQEFPIGFGEDGLLFTEDDPAEYISSGYSIVDLDTEPFTFSKEPITSLTLFEGDLVVNDLSEMTWSEGFEALHTQASLEYPFTEMKGIDWDALYEEIAPRIEAAEESEDETEYYLALRDYSWSIPDGHVGVGGGAIASELFAVDTAGGYGFAIIGLDDGRLIAHIVTEDGPAEKAGLEWGAEILEWNGVPVAEAVAEVRPWSLPMSSEELVLLQQYRYLLRAPLGTQAEVTFQNPGDDETTTVELTAVSEMESFSGTSIFAGFDPNTLPVEYDILPNGYGYIKISSLSDDINLIIRLWEWAIERMIINQVPAIIIDMRHNQGGSPLGSDFASSFVQERIDFSRSYYFSETSGEFETFRPPTYAEPHAELYYDGQLAVLVSPACQSACEDVSYVLSTLPQTRVFGFYATNGIFGEVGRGQYILPGGYSFQIPTGMAKDMEGNIIIEGTGVVPDERVPLTEETVKAQYVDGEDVVLDFAIEALNEPLGAGEAPDAPPKMGSKAEAETAFQANTEWLDHVALEEYDEGSLAQPGETYTFTIPLASSRELIWAYAWCTVDEESFEDNWSKIELAFNLNGEEIPIGDFAELEGVFSGNHCRAYYTVLSEWLPGEHIITTEVTFTDSFSDGISEEEYQAGTHIFEYHVVVAK